MKKKKHPHQIFYRHTVN